MILAINTAQHLHELALLDGGELLSERSWPAQRDDVERLVPTLSEMLDQLGLDKKDIQTIVVVKGPGSFTAVRTGVAFANALAEALGAELYAVDTFECIKRKAAIKDPLLVLLHAGGLDVALRHEATTKVGPISSLLADFPHNHSVHVVAELPDTTADELHSICLEKNWTQLEGHRLQTLGEALMTFGLTGLEPVPLVQPYYLKGPTITKSKNRWKQ